MTRYQRFLAWVWDHFPGGRAAQNAAWDALPDTAAHLDELAHRRDAERRTGRRENRA